MFSSCKLKAGVMSTVNYATLLLLFKMADAKHCSYIFESGDMKYFFCNVYEYCCGAMCCRSRAITFYQMWYFWLMVFLTILLCSGGGWWYRFRNQGPFASPSLASYHNPQRQIVPAGHYRAADVNQTSYPSAPPPPAPTVSHVYPAPPPYYGPPPSYDVAVNQRS